MPPTAIQPVPSVGFRNATEDHEISLPAIPYAAGGQSILRIPPVGYLANILLEVVASFTADDASITEITKSWAGPWNLIRRLRVVANNTDLVDISGYGLMLENLFSTYNYRGDQTGVNQDYRFTNVASASDAANNIVFGLEIPIALNDRDEIGLFPLQTEETVVQIIIDWANLSLNTGPYTDIESIDTIGSVVCNAYPTMRIFSVPPNPADRYTPEFIYQTLEQYKDITSVGEQIYTMPRGNTYTRLFWWLKLNGSLGADTDVTDIEMKFNQTSSRYKVRSSAWRMRNRRMYGRDIPACTYVMDMNHQGIPDLGDSRDYFNSRFVTDPELKNTVASGATIGTDKGLYVVRQQLVRMA